VTDTEAAARLPSKAATTGNTTAAIVAPGTDTRRDSLDWTPAKGARLRAEAAWRMVPLEHHRCRTRDPLACRCDRERKPVEIDYAACGLTEGLERFSPSRGWGAAA
jgi:hypothetical protein